MSARPEADVSARFERRIAFSALAATALVWVYAAIELRPLFADGFLYFLRILEHGSFWLEAPARRSVELMRQLPLLAALKLGVGDVGALAAIFGLSLQLLPLALVWLCWPALPRERKVLFAFPLLHYFAGTMGAAFAPITEGATAAAYFWLLFFLLLFRPARAGALLLVGALSLGTLLLHEGMVLLAPVLAAAAIRRARRESTRGARSVFALLAIWFLIVVAVQANFIAHPSHPENRQLFFTAMVSFWWLMGLWGTVNLPALFGVAALAILVILALGMTGLTRRGALRAPSPHAAGASQSEIGRAPLSEAEWGAPTRQRPSWLIWIALGAAMLGGVIYAAAADQMFAAQAQLNARNHALLLSLPLACLAFVLVVKPAAARRVPFRHAVVLSALLAAASLLWHVEATRRWSDYLGVFRQALRENRGLVAWEDALAQRPPRERRLLEGMSHYWIEPTMSIVLAPGGKVGAIISARREAGWYPFDARKPEQLPRARFWNYDDYLAAMRR